MENYSAKTDLSLYPVLLHADLSGIQPFIFNIKSEGAAKTLKSRSFYVQALADLCLDLIKEKIGERNCLLFYNGGGNFYLMCKAITDLELQLLREEVQKELSDLEIYLNLSVCELKADDFQFTWTEIHRKANQDKLQKFGQYFPAFFVGDRPQSDWSKFSRNLAKHKGFEVKKLEESLLRDRIKDTEMHGFGRFVKLSDNVAKLDTDNVLENTIHNKLPRWSGPLMQQHREWIDLLDERNLRSDPPQRETRAEDVIEFETLGYFAKLRTGTDKIAILKMDVDNLGDTFKNEVKDWPEAHQLSQALKDFFDIEMLNIWNDGFQYLDTDGAERKAPFSENIYVVFAGGDDCLIIGAWDAIFEFGRKVRAAFGDYLKGQNLPLDPKKLPTLSASLTVVDSKFPVVRMSDLAEGAIKKAKKASDDKNRISVFDMILTWEEFKRASEIAHELEKLIKLHDEPRGILSRVQNSHLGFERLQQKAIDEKTVHNPEVWRLFYYIRDSKNLDELKGIMKEYYGALLDAVTNGQTVNAAALFPVAARWAEFLTR